MSFRDLLEKADATLFSVAQFGEAVTYTPPGGGSPVGVYGLPRYTAVLLDGDISVSTTQLEMLLRAADISGGGPKIRATVVWRTNTYSIESVQGPDDSGMTSCVLRRSTNL